MKVWPFETGYRALTEAELNGAEVVAAEVYPSMLKTALAAGEVKDLAQVRAVAEHFARLDEAGKLGAAFGPSKPIDDGLRAEIELEEGWILGAG